MTCYKKILEFEISIKIIMICVDVALKSTQNDKKVSNK